MGNVEKEKGTKERKKSPKKSRKEKGTKEKQKKYKKVRHREQTEEANADLEIDGFKSKRERKV